MEEAGREDCGQLGALDASLGFLLLILLAVGLSWLALLRRRRALAGEGQGAQAEVYPLRLGADALVVGGLGFFFSLALEGWREADPGDPVGTRSAGLELLAAFLVLLAALIRLLDLNLVQRARPAPEGMLLPD